MAFYQVPHSHPKSYGILIPKQCKVIMGSTRVNTDPAVDTTAIIVATTVWHGIAELGANGRKMRDDYRSKTATPTVGRLGGLHSAATGQLA